MKNEYISFIFLVIIEIDSKNLSHKKALTNLQGLSVHLKN